MLVDYRCGGQNYMSGRDTPEIKIKDLSAGNRTHVVVQAQRDIELLAAYDNIEHPLHRDDLVLANGYQSWTETRAFAGHEHLNNLSGLPRLLEGKYHFKKYGFQHFHPWRRGVHQAFDYARVIGGNPLFIGNYNYRNAYLIIEFRRDGGRIELKSDLSGRCLRAGEEFTVFNYTVDTSGDEYWSHLAPKKGEKLFGYTSWYNHYQNINEQVIEQALDEASDEFDLFQIDDGFETFVGDWLDVDPVKFPRGLEPVVERIHGRNMLAGIWLAPLVAEKRSRVFREHPDWFPRDAKGKLLHSGSNWSGHAPLDLNNPDAVEYIRRVLRHYVDLGFDFFKLDFLYASNIFPLAGKTRAETAEFAYSLLRKELAGKLILGCGATLSNAWGKFNYCRIGPDVSLKFDDAAYMRLFHPERISTKITIQNTIYRSDMNDRGFLNDPDVFLLRDDNIRLSREQKHALITVNALFGSLLLTSDNVLRYDGDKRAELEEALALFHRAKVLDWQRQGDIITVSYRIDGQERQLGYDIERGVLTNPGDGQGGAK